MKQKLKLGKVSVQGIKRTKADLEDLNKMLDDKQKTFELLKWQKEQRLVLQEKTNDLFRLFETTLLQHLPLLMSELKKHKMDSPEYKHKFGVLSILCTQYACHKLHCDKMYRELMAKEEKEFEQQDKKDISKITRNKKKREELEKTYKKLRTGDSDGIMPF